MSSSPSRCTTRSPHSSPSSSPFSMAARTGTNPLPLEAFAAFSSDPTGAAAESAETESPEVTLRHDHDHLPQDTDHEILLNELSNLGCTETTLSILANNQVNRHLWLQILNSSDVDLTLRDELQIESGLSRARIKAAYNLTNTTTTTNKRDDTASGHYDDAKPRIKYLDIPKLPPAESGLKAKSPVQGCQSKSLSPQNNKVKNSLGVHKLYWKYYIVVCKKSLFIQELGQRPLVRLVEPVDAVPAATTVGVPPK